MSKFYFFTDASALLPQTEEQTYGPVAGHETTQYRVTSLHTATADVNAYAVCDGIVWAQYSDDNLINIILKPTIQPRNVAYPVKYYIYKGIRPDSIVDNADASLIKEVEISENGDQNMLLRIIKISQIHRDREYDKMMGNDENTTHRRASISAVGLDLTASYDNHSILDADKIDKAFQIENRGQLPFVTAGTVLGTFCKDNIGLEIIVDSVGTLPTAVSCRKSETVIICDSKFNPKSFDGIHNREQILNYIDPSSFYSSFFVASKNYMSGNESKGDVCVFDSNGKSKTLTNAELFNLLSQCFITRVYIDIRNEHNHSLDYYKHYGTQDSFAKIGYALGQNEITLLDYETNGWPILIRQIPDDLIITDSQPQNISISLELPVNGNSKPLIHLNSGYYAKTYPNTQNRYADLSTVANVTNLGYTVAVQFSVPLLTGFLTSMRYLKQTTNQQSASEYELHAASYIDNLFELTRLVNKDGLIAQHSSGAIKWNMLKNWAFVTEEAGYGTYYMADIGVATDLTSACFFAAGRKENLHFMSNAPSVEETLNSFSYFRDRRAVETIHTSDYNEIKVGTMTLLPDEMFKGNAIDKFSMPDGRTLIALFVTSDELKAVQRASHLFGDSYDRRLAINKCNDIDYNNQTYEQFELILRGYKSDNGTLCVGEEHTNIIFTKSENDSSRFFFSDNYMCDKTATDEMEKNYRDFDGSYLLPGMEMSLRTTPDNSSDSNIICRVTGNTKLGIFGKKKVGEHTWYCVGWDAAALKTSVDRGWIRAGVSDEKYEHAVYLTASLNRFLMDLKTLNDALDDHQRAIGRPVDNLVQRITRLRQRTHNCEYPAQTSIGGVFNKIIGSCAENPDPVYLDDIDYYGGRQEYIEINGVQTEIDTNIQLFADYMGVRLGNCTVIDLHHLFVGWDALNHRIDDTKEVVTDLLTLLFIDLSNIIPQISLLPESLGCNIDATTWAGDIGSVAADYIYHKKKTTLKQYFERNAPDSDIISDILPHLIYKYQKRGLSGNNMCTLLHYVLNDIQSGKNDYVKEFYSYIGFQDVTSISASVMTKMTNAVNAFSKWWYFYRQKKKFVSMSTDDIQDVWLQLEKENRPIINLFLKKLKDLYS